jgi:hypothetical protein
MLETETNIQKSRMDFIQYYSISVGRLLKEEKFAEHYQSLVKKM